MGRVLTNNTSFAYALEATETEGARGIGFLPGEDPGDGGGAISGSPTWKGIEPNEISQFGATISKVARNPIRRARGRQKGTISDLDSAVEFGADLTVDAALDFIEGFMFSNFSNDDLVFRGADAETTGDTYAVPSLSAASAAKLQFSTGEIATYLFASGYAIAGNNGLKTLDTAAVTSGTSVAVAENLVDETAPASARLEIAGAQLGDGEMDLTVAAAVDSVSGRIGTLTFDNVNPQSLGLTVGQIVYVRMTSVIKGYARLTAIGSATLTLDRMDDALVASAPTGATTDIFFGQFVRDVASDNSEFLERSFQFEGAYPGLAANGIDTEYEYAKGNFCSTLAIASELSDKTVFTAAFIGTDTDPPTGSRKTNAGSALVPLGTTAFSTVSDFARLRVFDVDEDGLTTNFKTIEVTIDNNISPEKVLNNLGAKFINFGNFFVDISTQVLFEDGNVLDRIRNNTTVALDMILKNDNGALAFSIPTMTLGDGSKELPVNETVLMNVTAEAFEDPVTGTSLGISFIPSVP